MKIIPSWHLEIQRLNHFAVTRCFLFRDDRFHFEWHLLVSNDLMKSDRQNLHHVNRFLLFHPISIHFTIWPQYVCSQCRDYLSWASQSKLDMISLLNEGLFFNDLLLFYWQKQASLRLYPYHKYPIDHILISNSLHLPIPLVPYYYLVLMTKLS